MRTGLLEEIASHGLGRQMTATVLGQDDVGGLLAGCKQHKLIGLADDALADGLLEGDEAVVAQIARQATEAAAWALVVERHLLQVHEVLSSLALEHRFLKGPTVAHRFYADPALRPFIDIDVLVEDPALEAAVSVLMGSDHRRVQPDPFPAYTRRYSKSVALRSTSGVEVDVHRTIADGPFGMRSSAAKLCRRPAAAVLIGSAAVPALDPAAAFVNACTSAVASYDRIALGTLRDVAQIGRELGDRVGEVAQIAEELGVEACVAEAIALAEKALRWEVPREVTALAQRPSMPIERAWLRSYRSRGRDLERIYLGVRAVPTLRGKSHYLIGVGGLLAGRSRRRGQRR